MPTCSTLDEPSPSRPTQCEEYDGVVPWQFRYGTGNEALTWRNVVPARLAAYPAQFSEWMTVCPGREVLAGRAWPAAVTSGPPGTTVTVPRVPPRVNALSVSTRDMTATAVPARRSFRIYRPFLRGEPRTLRGGRAGAEANTSITAADSGINYSRAPLNYFMSSVSMSSA